MLDEQFAHEPRVAVLGGSGFVGRAFTRHWANSVANPIHYLVHRSQPEWLNSSEVEVTKVNLEDRVQLLHALRGHGVLVNLLRPDGSGWHRDVMRTLNSIAAETGISRCIHASSIDVYAGVHARLVDEHTRPHPLSSYESEHLAAEAILMASFPETIVLRLGAVFGQGGLNLVSLADEMRHAPQWKIALRRFLYGTRRMHLVSVETVARTLVQLCVDRRPLGSQVVLITDDHDLNNNFAFVQDRLAAAFHRSLPRIALTAPKPLLRFLLGSRGLPTRNIDRRFSHARASDLGLASEPFADRLETYAKYLAEKAVGVGE